MTYPELSVIIPVLHEGGTINRCIQHLNRLHGSERCEIIVVDGSEQRTTARAIQSESIVTLISLPPCRARQMNAGAAAARGDILMFLHADTCLPPDAVSLVTGALEQPRYVGGAFDLAIRSKSPVLGIIARAASLRSRLSRMPYGDQALFIRREYYEKIGRFSDIPLMEDVELMRRIKRRGDSICIIRERVTTSPRRWEREGIVRCTLRNRLLVTLYCLGCSPHTLVKYYRSDTA